MLFGGRIMSGPESPLDPSLTAGVLNGSSRVEARLHRGEWLLLHFYRHTDGDALRAFTRLELDGDRVARLKNYFYTPEAIAELGRELGLTARHNGYRGCRREPS
jgi:RNA polymerase sigma-70 factor (ECF subfamily)